MKEEERREKLLDESAEGRGEKEQHEKKKVEAGGERKEDYVKKIAAAAAVTAAVYLAFRYLLSLFLPLVIAFFLAYLLYPVVRFLRKKLHFAPMLAGGMTLITFLAVFVWGLVWLGRKLTAQLVAFFQNFEIYEEYMTGQVDDICRGCDRFFRMKGGTTMGMVERGMTAILERIRTEVLPALTARTLELAAGTAAILAVVLITLILTLLFLKDMEQIKRRIAQWQKLPRIGEILRQLEQNGTEYIRTQFIIMLIIMIVLTVGFLCIGNPYALLLGIAIAILDAFPMLGTGLVLVPWGIIRLLGGDYFAGILLIVIFIVCQVLREVLEPKLLGGRLGIHPATALMAIYIGIQLFGVSGVVLGPVGLIVIRSVLNLP